MEFGLEKCEVLYIKHDNIDDSPLMPDILSSSQEELYKYLSIMEVSEILHDRIKAKTTKEFI